MNKKLFYKTILSSDKTIKDAIHSLNSSMLKIVLVVNNKKVFLGTVTDGDIRRCLLKKFTLNSNILLATNLKSKKIMKDKSRKHVLDFMIKNKIQRLPVIDQNKNPIYLYCIEDFLEKDHLQNKFIIMAGGKGLRMGSLTKKTPKPLLLVKKKPIIKHIIEKASKEGFRDFYISVNYLASKIINYLGNGKKFKININYLIEKKTLGTAGSLSMLNRKIFKNKEPIVITNGDLISKIKFKNLIDFHQKNQADMTIVAGLQKLENPFGVINLQGIKIKSVIEKPITRNYINAGIYVINSNMIKYLRKNSRIDMTEFFKILNEKKKKIVVYPLHEPWIDIGNKSNLKIANEKKYFE